MRITCLLIVLVGMLGMLGAAERIDFDRPLVYVNDHVITRGDLSERYRVELQVLQQQGQSLPRSVAEQRSMQAELLEKMVDEEVLYQEAQRLGVQIDTRRLRRMVIDEANRLGFGDDMASIAQAVTERTRQEMLRQVLLFYRDQLPEIGPERIRAHYEEHWRDYRRPGRRHLYRIALPVREGADRQVLIDELLRLVRVLRGHAQPAIRALVDDDLVEQVIAADQAGQLTLLLGLIERLLAVPELATTDVALAEHARSIQQAGQGLMTRAEAEAAIEAWRAELVALPDNERLARFQALARAHSRGPDAPQGGDLGWLEEGSLGLAEQEALADCVAGDLSPLYWAGNACCLLFVAEYEAPQQRSLQEVSSEIAAQLEQAQDEAVADQAIASLRDEAEITLLSEIELP